MSVTLPFVKNVSINVKSQGAITPKAISEEAEAFFPPIPYAYDLLTFEQIYQFQLP